jgi:predicted transcriptional regulator
MKKQEAMELLEARTQTELADRLGISQAAVSQWSEELPEHAVRRVESQLYRRINKRGRRNATP